MLREYGFYKISRNIANKTGKWPQDGKVNELRPKMVPHLEDLIYEERLK